MELKSYTLPVVTLADQVGEYKYYTLESIAGIRLIKSLTDAELRACKRNTATFRSIHAVMGFSTNPTWIKNRACEELYNRNLIDHEELHILTR